MTILINLTILTATARRYRLAIQMHLLAPILGLISCTSNPQQESNQIAQSTNDPVAEVARLISSDLDIPVAINVFSYRRADDWIFMTGNPTDEAGEKIDYTKIHYENDWSEGYFDDVFLALFRLDNETKPTNTYDLVEFSFGATDAPFLDWKTKHALPDELFQSNN